ncbi:AbrB/MazE/SpoVT family DNA-binding domain-containing protein [Cyanobium sp. HWJ4-Hawea]|uniref:AbrB/MazE/SpoVT family DNA-binding domain-containing protein n=1 Tax=Cyanobium sp. HWJ4-Hawea TaxID=2823713 RepID=UPI0020CE18A6|nr:AbrB/MazE/SpoVT family DNA-binding domain-containing protein [Cyanobium sp. HWJ4-Hawea]MCP9809327.1 AbrB/MazE/SpoVT family DNA-binding domain-containing protein [Cyanobium sp. HWJ4-Hawea]
MDVSTVSPKFQVVIPKRSLEQFGLCPGQQLQVIALPGRIALLPSQPPAALRGFLYGDNTFERKRASRRGTDREGLRLRRPPIAGQ